MNIAQEMIKEENKNQKRCKCFIRRSTIMDLQVLKCLLTNRQLWIIFSNKNMADFRFNNNKNRIKTVHFFFFLKSTQVTFNSCLPCIVESFGLFVLSLDSLITIYWKRKSDLTHSWRDMRGEGHIFFFSMVLVWKWNVIDSTGFELCICNYNNEIVLRIMFSTWQ